MNINLKKINFRYVIIILLLIFVVGFIFFPFTSNSRDLRDVRSFDDANLDYTVSVDRTVNFYEDKDNQKDFTTRHDLFQNRKISETRPARNKGFYITLEDKDPKEAIWSSPDGISFTNVENPQNVVLVSDIISYDDILNIKKYDELGEREVSYNNENKKYSAVATDEVDTFFLTEYLSAISDSKDFLQ